MRYQLYRSVPVVWRSGTCVQFGIDDPVLIDGLTAADAELISAVRMGIGAGDFDARAAQLNVSPARAASLLSLLDEAGALIPAEHAAARAGTAGHIDAYAAGCRLEPSTAAGQLTAPHVLVLGPLRRGLYAQLVSAGMRVEIIERAEDALTVARPLVVMTGVWVEDAVGAGFLHDHEIEHCHLTIGQQQARLSHIVRAQQSPCTACAFGFRSDEDENWFAAWQGLWQQTPAAGQVDPVLCALSFAQTAAQLRDHILGRSDMVTDLVFSLTGAVEERTPQFHPSCSCQASVPQMLSSV
ncbi:hypothetical protein [Brevibacterium otitidis]|uniref:Bacteriocin biosynthesis cyclodehydratase domain-containing protein n=1 Tax=Brevibacterium otitidis TaxID=53364 RepID=A0ABV5X465_9MICO|nr:hypothetical protein GCM10023233_15980 [Brevibacterium otitidis]